MTGCLRWLAAGAFAIAVLAAGLLVSDARPARAAAPTDVLPNLVADPPAHASLDYYSYPGGGHDLLLRFDGYVHNAGQGALEMNASRASSADPLPPVQRIYRSDSSTRDLPMAGAQLAYSNADGHNHWHLQNAVRYSLWTSDHASLVAPSSKVGFCLGDIEHVDSFGPSSGPYQNGSDQFCQHNNPGALSLVEGVSAGWRDIYAASLAMQWVVASDVQPGIYALREDVDPDGIVAESNETNAPAWSASATTIPGYVAKPVTGGDGAFGQPQDLTLDATKFGSPGARRFRIVTPPAHGSLDVSTGATLTSAAVVYTPDDGYSGPDEFTYEALDSTTSYPLHPRVATVSLSVAAAPKSPQVVIDSAPTSVETGHGAQLTATVTDDLPGVTWSVDGTDGGSTGAGTITPDGFYTAPATVPPGGHVSIAARSSSGAHDERVVAVTSSSAPPPAPGTDGTPHPRPGSLLSTIVASRHGRILATSVIPAKSGIVYLKARAGSHHLGYCRAKLPARQRFTCRTNLRIGQKLGKLKIVARLYRSGRLVASAYRRGAPARR